MNHLAPIGVSTYSRLDHLKQTITALQNNTLAKQSNLYIFSDSPQPGDEKKVAEVRQYIQTITGFKKVHFVGRTTNDRVANNRGGIKQLLDQYGKIIFLEEDVVTAPGFLQFINDALNFYQSNEQIFSITGYSPPIGAYSYTKDDIFTLPRFSAWGFGIWKDRFDKISKVSMNEFIIFSNDKKAVKLFLNGGGEDMLPMLRLEVDGKINALDVRAMFCQFKNRQLTIYPKKSLTQNIGHDGSGLHCGITNKFEVELWSKIQFRFKNNIQFNKKILKANQKFRKIALQTKIIEFTKKHGILSVLKFIKNKVWSS